MSNKCPYCELSLKWRDDICKWRCGVCESEFDPTHFKVAGTESKETLAKAKKILKKHAFEEQMKFADMSVHDHSALSDVPKWKQIVGFLGIPLEKKDFDHAPPFVLGIYFILALLLHIFGAGEFFYLKPDNPLRFLGLNFFSYSLVHVNLAHLLFNLFFCVAFLGATEESLGGKRTLYLILVSSFLSGFLHLLFDSSGFPLAGSSGVCFGIVSYYGLSFPKRQILLRIPFLSILAYRYSLIVYARTFAFCYVAMEVMGVIRQISGTAGNVSHLGHIGGAFAGYCFFLLFGERKSNEQQEEEEEFTKHK